MKPLLKIIETEQNRPFRLMTVNEPFFYPSWHFHPEFEIMLVLEGTGIRYAGDSVEKFFAGDLVLYGSYIPHLYKSDDIYFKKYSNQNSKAIVVYFKENFLGNDFFEIPDLLPIKTLFHNSKRGIKFTGKSNLEILKNIKRLEGIEDGIERILILLNILKLMSKTQEYTLLTSCAFNDNIQEIHCERINKIYKYILINYAENPTLEEISGLANMTVSAFCRYFKSHTNKTYTQFLNEIKISNACKLLIENNFSISQICFEIGFNNFAHFNGQFKKIIGFTPSEYRNRNIQLNPISSLVSKQMEPAKFDKIV